MTAATLAAVIGAVCILPLWAAPPAVAQGGAAFLHLLALAIAALRFVRCDGLVERRERLSRYFLSASMAVVAIAMLVSLGYVVMSGSVPSPSVADPIALLWVPLAAYGLWLVPSHDGRPMPTRRLAADGAVAATSLLFISWLLVLTPLTRDGTQGRFAEALQLAFPVADVFIATLVVLVLPRVRADQRAFLSVAAVGLVFVAIADSATAVRYADTGALSFGWPAAATQAGLGVLAFGAGMGRFPDLVRRPTVRSREWAIPFLAPLLAMMVVAGIGLRGESLGSTEILLGVVMVLAVLLRQRMLVREVTLVAEEYLQAAVHDGLTGLPNRKAFLAQLEEQTRMSCVTQAAVVILDLDGFKGINDTLGHDAGDRVLVDFGAILSASAHAHFAARLGGDEFAVLVLGAQPEEGARRIAAGVARSAMPHAGGMTVTCSAGISGLRPGDSAATALRRADLAMFWVKRTPQVQVAVFDESMAERAARRNLLVAQLPGVVERGELRLVYQPLYRLAEGRLAGAETLLRWHHPVLGDVPPDEFIPLAEESGDIRAIGSWVLDQAIGQVAAWRRRGRVLPQLFVNVAAAQFTDELPHEVAAALLRHAVSPHCLVVEITESQMPGLATNRAVQRLRESGVRVGMDDFGSGYSSLAQLARLPVDVLKIDRHFIRNLEAESGRHVLDAVVSLARSLGLETVAEGIEEPAQADEVRGSGIDYAQGYLFARPLEAEELFARLAPPVVAQQRSAQGDRTTALD